LLEADPIAALHLGEFALWLFGRKLEDIGHSSAGDLEKNAARMLWLLFKRLFKAD
jgi:hypothetical protein